METFYKFMHQWCVPLFHMLLWATGLFLTTELPGISSFFPTTKEPLNTLVIFTVFFLEISMSLFDIAVTHQTKVIDIKIFIYLAPFVAILALTNAATIMYCFDLSRLRIICSLIFLSASVKGMNVWLQNNIDKFTISVPQGSRSYNSLTINNA